MKIAERIQSFTEVIREKFTSLIDSMIPDEDITKTSILFWFIIIFTTIAIFWGLFAKIDMVVRAQGNVIPASKVQVAQAVYGGILEKISVSLGDEVKKGDILYVIDGKNNEAEYVINERAYESTMLELETRSERVALIEDLVNEGAESKMRLLDEKLALVDTQRRLSEISSRREALKFQKDQSVIRSPVDGIISSVDVTTEGQVLKPGQLLSNIVPKGEQLIVAAKVQTQDISFVNVGQNVKITFSAYDPSVYGTFNGKVTKVAATSTLANEENAAPFYETLIEVDDDKINDIIIQSGMTVDTSIIGQKRTVWGYVFNPVTKLKRTAFREK
tara:strand:- start:12831 stop:13823 length:993 start_codon:yes stop_codon:yes gene_type:complete